MTRNKTSSPGRRFALAVTAAGALLVAAACGDDGGEDALSPFCQEFTDFDEKWGELDPEAFFSGELKEEADQVISDLRNMEPPADIAEDWPTFVDSIEAVVGDPEAAASDPSVAADQESFQKVQNYVNQECVGTETE